MILLLKLDNDNLKKNTFNVIEDYIDQIDQVQKNHINQKVFNKIGLIYENKILKVINEDDDFETFCQLSIWKIKFLTYLVKIIIFQTEQ